MPIPSDIVFVRVMCSGMVNPQAVLAAFADGADGVLILGCHPGSCHYVDGNLQAQRRVGLIRALLKDYGVNPERLGLDWASASEGERFAQLVQEFHARMVALGPQTQPLVLGEPPVEGVL